jgi:hypothetical protein
MILTQSLVPFARRNENRTETKMPKKAPIKFGLPNVPRIVL